MEMQAWIEGLTAIYEKYGKCDIIVYCDSQVIGKGFKGENKRKSNLDLWELLLSAARKHHHVEWEWVKGHNGNLFNVEADKLAGAVRKQGKKENEECLKRKSEP
jgi:ribonuclease HI